MEFDARRSWRKDEGWDGEVECDVSSIGCDCGRESDLSSLDSH